MEITTMTKNTSYLFKQSPDNSVIPYLHKESKVLTYVASWSGITITN